MPPGLSVTQIRLNNIIKCLATTATSLEVLAGALKEPALEAISYTTRALLKNVEIIKQNKVECIQLLERTHELLNAILLTHVKSHTGADLSPSVSNDIAKFTQTLYKVHTFVEAQQKGSKIKRLFRQGELSTLLKNCKEGLQQGLDSFQIDMGKLMTEIDDIQRESNQRHDEVLHFIEALSDAGSDRASTMSPVYSGFYNSSASISMLPSEPKIFHGRETELVQILQLFSQGVPRVTILGAGGMGKTTLAGAVLHHVEITKRYMQHRHFVPCDSATTKVELAALVGAHLGLKPGKDLTQAVVQHLSGNQASLLILDNLETAWEPLESRKEVEEFLSLLTDMKHLALIVTMRGAERPAKVAWTHPFLAPLGPLKQDAARQTFIDIADDVHNPEAVDKVLALTDNMPLAISLLAHLVDSEGCSMVLSRWDEEKTSLVSDGWDRKSNLDLSISLSLSSPRLRAFSDSHKLLSLLSMLPNGLSDVDLVQSNLPIDKVLGCKAVLVGTSLAYYDSHKRLRVLAPIREYLLKIQPPHNDVIRTLRRYFQELLEFWKEYQGTSFTSGTVARISSNLANIHSVLQKGLVPDHPDLVDCIYCTCYLNRFSHITGHGMVTLMKQIPHLFPLPCDHRLEASFASELVNSRYHHYIKNVETVISEALPHIEQCNDSDLQCSFYISLANLYLSSNNDSPAALNCCQKAVSLAIPAGNRKRHFQALRIMAWANWYLGHSVETQACAQESQRLARISGNLYGEAQGLDVEITCGYRLNYSESLSLCNRARDLLAACGMSHSNMDHNIMNSQSEVYNLKSEYTEARNIQQEILREAPIAQDPLHHGLALLNTADLDVSMGVPKDIVQQNIDTVRTLFKTVAFAPGSSMCNATLADLALREGNMPAAKALFLGCLNSTFGKNVEFVSYCLERLGDASRWDPSSETSSWATVLLAHALKIKDKLLIHKALLSLGQIFHRQADEDTAISLFDVALAEFTYMDVHRSRAECMLHLGDLYKGQGDLLKAVELWDTARPLFERSSQSKQVKNIDDRLASIDKNVLQQHRKSFAKLGVPSGTIEEVEDNLSDVEDSVVVEAEEGALVFA